MQDRLVHESKEKSSKGKDKDKALEAGAGQPSGQDGAPAASSDGPAAGSTPSPAEGGAPADGPGDAMDTDRSAEAAGQEGPSQETPAGSASASGSGSGQGGKGEQTAMFDLVGVLTHKGRSADSGHYVAWVKQESGEQGGAVSRSTRGALMACTSRKSHAPEVCGVPLTLPCRSCRICAVTLQNRTRGVPQICGTPVTLTSHSSRLRNRGLFPGLGCGQVGITPAAVLPLLSLTGVPRARPHSPCCEWRRQVGGV